MAWCRIGDKPLSEPMLTWFIDAYMRHQVERSFKDLVTISLLLISTALYWMSKCDVKLRKPSHSPSIVRWVTLNQPFTFLVGVILLLWTPSDSKVIFQLWSTCSFAWKSGIVRMPTLSSMVAPHDMIYASCTDRLICMWCVWSAVSVKKVYLLPLQWRHNDRVGVSNHRRLDCLLNRSFRPRSKKTSKLRVTGLCEGNSPVAGEFPAQRARNAKMFPFDDVIMHCHYWGLDHFVKSMLRSMVKTISTLASDWLAAQPSANQKSCKKIPINFLRNLAGGP